VDGLPRLRRLSGTANPKATTAPQVVTAQEPGPPQGATVQARVVTDRDHTARAATAKAHTAKAATARVAMAKAHTAKVAMALRGHRLLQAGRHQGIQVGAGRADGAEIVLREACPAS